MLPRDHVDWALERWAHERPDVDTAAKAVIQRIGRAARHIERATARVFEPFGLDPHEFYVLGVLRRAGAPFRMTPTALARTLLLTAGSVTHRINSLERAGLVTRIPDPADRRVVLVELTPRGLELADRAIETFAEVEARIVEPLAVREQEELARLLRTLLLSFGDEPPA